ncbi:hypothetical protein WOLCODRAFT_155004 [Wolfiporia cocos MD-104 SS10]|uniref:Uncharacterized protein n=1 Tax=Wolfiporia cocos (strain MD-104) TaxID=742152 RepID=A0A2H3JYA5_WOLCO|nr:hypothetical protein WOLCODRAFT_155004 [Wolfiporia cocos MD-104 SS10]
MPAQQAVGKRYAVGRSANVMIPSSRATAQRSADDRDALPWATAPRHVRPSGDGTTWGPDQRKERMGAGRSA